MDSVSGGSGGLTLKPGTTGTGRLEGAVGATDALAALEVQGAAAIDGGSVRTTGGQTYTGETMLTTGFVAITCGTRVLVERLNRRPARF